MKTTVILCFLLEISLVLSAPGTINNINLFDVQSSDVTFRLYTPGSPTNYINLQTGQLTGAALDISMPFKFIIHGYTDNAGKDWVINMKNEYLKKGAYNVIAVDWSWPALELYPVSATNTRDVGKYVALFITDLKNTLGVPFQNIHLIGHSLGSHVSGFCGQYLKASVGTTIARITGMDPAGPEFFTAPPDSRLSPGDAIFTDIIHTDGYNFGYYSLCGDIDFYPNGGVPVQPGCLTRAANEKDVPVFCSHARSYIYHTESINSLGFIANECDSLFDYVFGLCKNNQAAVMGENVDQSLKGVFYLTTNAFSPFARNGNI